MSRSRAAIEVSDVWYRYSATSPGWTLQGLNLLVEPGAFTVVTGPSGCGKSTLLYLIAGLLNRGPDRFKGTIRLQGMEKRPRSAGSSSLVGLLLQDPSRQLHQLTVLDELRSGPLYAGASWADADKEARNASEGLVPAELWSASPRKISVGQQQRVALASLLALHREVLLLDEPFSCLDGSGARDLLGLLLRLVDAGSTVVVSTHDVGWLGHSPRSIVLMDSGKAVSTGPPGDILPSATFDRLVGTPLSVRVAAAVAPTIGRPLLTWGDLASVTVLQPRSSVSAQTTSAGEQALPSSGECLLDVQHLFAARTEQAWILEDVSLSVQAGTALGVVGRNGGGKCTLGLALFAAVPRVRGDFRLRSGAITKKPQPVPGDFCYLPQNPTDMLFETTCFREVAFGPRLLRDPEPRLTAEAALAEVGLASKEHDHPRALSAGQQRLLTLASVLACQPSLLFLDEPEYGLDQKSWEAVARIIRLRAARGLGIILVSHNLELVFGTCSHLLVIEGGRAAWLGPATLDAVANVRHLFEPLTTHPAGLDWLAWSSMNGLDRASKAALLSKVEELAAGSAPRRAQP